MTSPAADDVPRLASVQIVFCDPPDVTEADRIVSIVLPIDGLYVSTNDRTLPFQPLAPVIALAC